MSEWRHATVGDLIDVGHLLVSDGYRARNDELGPTGTPFVRGGDIGDGSINTAPTDHVKPKFFHRIEGKLSRSGDTAFITKGTVGRAGFLRCDQPSVVFAPQVAYWRSLDREVLDSRFLFYFIRSRTFQSALKAVMTRGSMVADYVSIAEQRRFKMPVPFIEEQRRIGSLLGLLDDKIDLNRRTNETLEMMARAIFKDWFVDFGPTRAKMEGRAPYLAPDLWALFPNRLDEDGRPEGAVVGTLKAYASLNPESWSSTTYPPVVRYVDLSVTKWGYIRAVETYGRGEAPSRAQRILRAGDSIVGTVRPGNGSFALIGRDGLTGSTGFAVLRPKKAAFREAIYLAATAASNIERLSHLADGGAYPAVRPDAVADTEVVLLCDRIVRGFSTVTAPLLDKLHRNEEESATLAATRDLLLPKLMSGELRVREAEKVLEAAL